ncbi:HypC/HybG/HupF family hydrogenase formation chaperone [Chromobacterium alticapitis]|uniref:HypC/HybG/HupF family hydrogenase formation chaperone n=1 Tax=Chromobacterium alticapitis TaxID=2073169 RepID=A0A2S5DE75_9NEIS|nr:HypC/HybG/HupF family hydrogenase formation chaperone [Chromobacterium alticapitis]POZ61339.1 HypC/HybG/HupF family hydrogenase formation chaperone [Chromobacterium alticapitis]
MCLAIPARVTEILEPGQAKVELGGVHKLVSTVLVDDVSLGDYLIVHVGFAIGKLDPDEAERTLALLAEMGAAPDNPSAYR